MDVFTVSLFGHRELADPFRLKDQLVFIIKELIRTKTYVTFLIGRNGEFDKYAASAIRHARKEIGEESSELALVLPYTVARLENYKTEYDDVIIPESVHGAHPKAAITLKNRWMVERSDLVIVYVERNKGGAYTAMKYATKLKKDVINLYTMPSER